MWYHEDPCQYWLLNNNGAWPVVPFNRYAFNVIPRAPWPTLSTTDITDPIEKSKKKYHRNLISYLNLETPDPRSENQRGWKYIIYYSDLICILSVLYKIDRSNLKRNRHIICKIHLYGEVNNMFRFHIQCAFLSPKLTCSNFTLIIEHIKGMISLIWSSSPWFPAIAEEKWFEFFFSTNSGLSSVLYY